MSTAARLDILIDIQAKLGELLKSQEAFRAARNEAQSFGNMLRTGLGIDLARRGVDLLKASIIDSAREAFRMAGQLKDVSQNLQTTTDELQVLTEHVKDNGGEFQTLTTAIVQYRGVLAQARQGNVEAAKTLRDLGTSADELAAMPLSRQMEVLSRGIFRADREAQAFDTTVQLLGSKNAPKLMQSLRELADQGYDKLAQKMREAGRVMSEDTIDRLDRAQKKIEEFKGRMTIQIGETIGLVEATTAAVQKSFWSTFGSLMRIGPFGAGIGQFAAQVASQQPAKEPEKTASGPKMATSDDLTLASIARIDQAMASIGANPVLTEIQRRQQLLVLLNQQVRLYRELIEAQFPDGTDLQVKHALGTMTEEELSRFRQYVQLLTQLEAKENAATAATGLGPAAMRGIREQFGGINDPSVNANALSAGDGLQAGVMRWATDLGSTGEQVARSMQASIGAAVDGIGSGIYGWITGTQTWASTLQSIGQTILQTMLNTIIQMGVQMVVSAMLGTKSMIAMDQVGEALRAKRMAATAAEGAAAAAANAPGAAAASISSFGAAAAIGLIALLAVMAAFGGFRELGGPVERGTPYIVGEKRPEVFVPDQPGRIVPSVDAFYATQRGGGAMAAGAGEALSGKQQLLVVYSDNLSMVEGLKRRPEFEALVVDINRRNAGEIFGG